MMPSLQRACIFAAVLMVLPVASLCQAHQLSGYAAIEGSYFLNSPLYEGQSERSVSLALQPEYYHAFSDGPALTLVPFLRWDSADSQRSHLDLREFNLLSVHENWELRAGVSKVFWGATEFVHLIDVINQTDALEDIDNEDKLGQPLMQLTLIREWGVVQFFALPYFRERQFPGKSGRLRAPLVVDVDKARYESSAEESHLDLATRYSRTIGSLDFGLSYFSGTNREPLLLPGLDGQGQPLLTPYYNQMQQAAFDGVYVQGEWLWKLEACYRSSSLDDYLAATGGFEYSFMGVAASAADLGIIVEYGYDERGEKAGSLAENDLMLGVRLALNDQAGTELLAGCSVDLDHPAQLCTLEASRRYGNNVTATLEAALFLDQERDDLAYSLRDDDFLKLEIRYFF